MNNTASRLPLPAAYLDPAFLSCVQQAFASTELVQEFDRLHGCSLSGRTTPVNELVDIASGKKEADVGDFVRFVHECIYLRVEDEVLAALRQKAH